MSADESPRAETEMIAQQQADQGRVGLRLSGDTSLYESPDVAAVVKKVLPSGSLVTVGSDAGAFLYVTTAEDEFGYIADETPVLPVLRTPDTDRPRPVVVPAQAPTAREVIAGLGSGSEAMAAAGAMPLRRDDESFVPARPLTIEERVLIYDRIAQNRRGSFIFVTLFVLLLAAFFAAIGIFLSGYARSTSEIDPELSVRIAIAALLCGLAIGILMYFMAASAVMAVSGAHQVSKAEEPELYRIVENLCIGSGLPMPKVWVIEDSAPNAFATGRGAKSAHVAVTRGLLDKLEKRELEAVIAHELSHIGNLDIRLMAMLAVGVGMVALLADTLMRFTWYGAGARSSNRGRGGGGLGVILLIAAILLITLAPIAASLLRLAVSRKREYLADSSGALLCRNPDALADALEKIAADPEPLEAANKATAHLYISNPLREHKSFLNNLFSTHPPVSDRIRLLRAMA